MKRHGLVGGGGAVDPRPAVRGNPRGDAGPPVTRTEALRSLQARLGYVWRQQELLSQALRHPSFTRGDRVKSNQRLEWLGDSVLDLIMAVHLMHLHPREDEGFLTQARASMVRDVKLADKGRVLGLHKLIEIQETAPGIRDEVSTAADCMEAVIGAAFVDSEGDLQVVHRVIANAGLLG